MPGSATGSALGVSSVTWTWAAVASADSYSVYAASDGALLAWGLIATSFTQTELSPNTAAGLRVAAVNASGRTGLGAATTAYTLAVPPRGTWAKALPGDSVLVQWAQGGATAYAVERSTASEGGFIEVASPIALGAASQFTDTGLSRQTTYYYRVRAFNGDGLATGYDVTSSTISYAAPPGNPILSGLVVASGTIRWSWIGSDGPADNFILFTSSGRKVASLSGRATFYLETEISTAAVHSRYLVAVNPNGEAFSSTVTVATPRLQSFVTGIASGTLKGANGKAQLMIPPNTLGADANWLLSETPMERPLMHNAPSLIAAANGRLPPALRGSAISVAEFMVTIGGNRHSGPLPMPVMVQVPYPDSRDTGFVDDTTPPVKAETLQLYVLNEASGLWEAVPGSKVDRKNKTVTGSMSHLSIFSAFGVSAAAGPSAVRVYPVPYRPNGDNPDEGVPYSSGDANSGIIFDNLPAQASVKIFDLAGRLVASFNSDNPNGKLRWDGRNDAGHDVTSGGYLAVINSPGEASITKKLLIVR